MPRQLRNRGGMTVKTVRQKYGLGSLVKKTIRKLIPNELADIAVKAAPFVAPFNPGAAALMRGVGRFDQRGSISDALKQGAATFAFGKVAGKLGGAEGSELGNVFGGQKFTMENFRQGPIGSLFPKTTGTDVATLPKAKPVTPVTKEGTGIIRSISEATLGKVPLVKQLPKSVMDQLVVGGITSGASALYSYFSGDFRPQEEGETMEEYLAARKASVGKQMRTFMDNYYRFDPEYSAMSDAEKDAFVARYNMNQGGIARLGYRTGDLVDPRMRRSLSENVARNEVQREIGKAVRSGNFRDFLLQNVGAGGAARFGGLYGSPGNPQGPFTGTFQSMRDSLIDDITRKRRMDTEAAASNLSNQPPRKNPLQLKIERNQKIFRDYVDKIGGPVPGVDPMTGQPQTPFYEQQALLDQLTPLTFEENVGGETFETLSDIDQYRLAQVYPEFESQRRNPTFTPINPSTAIDIFNRRFGVKKGGIMNVPVRTNSEGVKELDYRKTGGFVPIGVKEKADDVPAMLSKNEFVFTADAVRGAGNGSIKKGAQRMYDTMKKLESRVG